MSLTPIYDEIGPNERPPFGCCLLIWGASREAEIATAIGAARLRWHAGAYETEYGRAENRHIAAWLIQNEVVR